MKIEVKNPGTVLLFVLGGVALAYTFCMFMPGQLAIKQVRAEIQSRQLYFVDSPQVALQVSQLEEELRVTREYIANQQERLPKRAELSAIAGTLTTCASQAGVRIVRFAPQTQASETTLARASVQISVEGDLDQLFDFAARLEALEAPVWCQQFNLATNSNDTETIVADFDLLIFAANIEKSG